MARPSIFATTLALLFVIAAQSACAQSQDRRELPDWREFPEIDISVRGVTLGTPYAEVLKRLGEPLAYAEHGGTPLPDCLPKSAVFVYLGLVVRLGGAEEDRSDFHVWSIEVNANNWAVAPGIRVGESMEDVRRLLGEPGHVAAFGGKQRNIIYATAGKTGIATLVFPRGEKLQLIVLTEACRRERPAGGARRAGQ